MTLISPARNLISGVATSTMGYAVDDLISEFLTETAESLEVVDSELVKFEANPTERKTLDNIFRLVHTVKGTCGFLGLSRLEAVAHAGETLLGEEFGRCIQDLAMALVAGNVLAVRRGPDGRAQPPAVPVAWAPQ